jgi:hypothetical protein
MGAFDDREKGFERKYQLDQEQEFRAQARRDRLFGQWAAGQLGYDGDKAAAYAKEVAASNFEKPGDDDMLDKVRADFKAGNVTVADNILTAKLTECFSTAAAQIAAESQ